MSSGIIFLLGLVFCLEQRIWAQHGLPECSDGSYLREGLPVTWYNRISQGTQGLPMFFTQPVTYINAGIYYSVYQKRGGWSGPSDSMDLVVAGVYKDTPSLTASPGPNVTLGENVALLCQASQYYHIFNLSKDGRNASTQEFLLQNHKTYLISPMTLAHGGTYKCCGSSKISSYRWSLPSNPVKLLVTNPLAPENGYLPIVIGVLAIVVLILLFLLWLTREGFGGSPTNTDCWLSTGNIDNETKNQVNYTPVMDFREEINVKGSDVLEDIQLEDRQMDIHDPIEEDTQEVTYVQVHQKTLTRSVDTFFS
ncbi:unnamed protein product [Nyctereutes procyonoides]|uniref:(raccoon dog) hypothetical protein n=1 Tax=Nyctereutes procyonoides TaxID=34880 RepID=A0A811ZU90_NYCPR|nr:unnamed protein product [Nyctereutes procyonoides]